ncbi:amiloride-sensitive sodium channel subunit alpha-like isoform X1 [Lytechinus variegatus]|uniref:amiloride-sensitive sodium channel subunit alpha-like isoform X1 n=1 Tax=Lytechinus variegatus TaxID=7654 RepID=UPI001BB2CE29|nr:amiloride-sensitive sodium channel subunit alpha-like isoform X1 [Lytechinus variegatus]
MSSDNDDDTVGEAVYDFGKDTTVHGVRYMIARGHFLFRLCWLAIVIFAFVLFGIQAANVYSDYSASPYSTKIDIIQTTFKAFPAVTVCNVNRIRRSRLYDTNYEGLIEVDDIFISEYLEDEESVNKTESVNEPEAEERENGLWSKVDDQYDWMGFYAASQADDFSDLINVVNPTKEELTGYGHQLERFIVQCTYDQQPCNASSKFEVLQSRYYGNCFTFNFGRNGDLISTSKTGALNGLHLTLWIEDDEYMGLLSPYRGAKVTIHPQNILPLPEDEGINVATGMATSIGIREEVVERLPEMTSCVEDNGEGTNFTVRNNSSSYTVAYCLKLCFQQSLINRCGCVDGILLNYTHCDVLNTTQRNCLFNVQELYINNNLDCYCPLPCEERNFKKTISSIDWPSDRYMDHLTTRFSRYPDIRRTLIEDEERAKRNLIRLQIYYETLNNEVVVQVPRYSIPNILGNWGGLMGLFTGMSFISVFEVIFLLLRVSKISCKKLLFRNRVQPIKT